MGEQFQANLQQCENAYIVDLVGDVTIAAQDMLDQAYKTMAQANASKIVLNFANSDYVTSNGLSLITGLVIQARREGRQVYMTGLTPHLQKLCRMMGLSSYAEMLPSVQDALRQT